MGAEVVVFRDAAPVGVNHGRTLFAWSETITPMVLVGKTTSRPPQNRDMQVPQRRYHIVADAARIRDGAVLTHPNSFIDASTKVLGEMTVNVAADRILRLVCLDDQLILASLSAKRGGDFCCRG